MKRILFVTFAMLSAVVPAAAQGTQADYDRALGLRKKYEALVGSVAETPRWIGRTHKVYYRRTVKGGHDFILVDADTKAKGPAFDHGRIAAALSAAAGKTYGALDLPFNAFDFVDGERAIQFVAESETWRCEVAASTCRKATAAEAQQGGGRGGRGGGRGTRAPPAAAAARPADGAPQTAAVAGRHEGSADLELQRHRARCRDEDRTRSCSAPTDRKGTPTSSDRWSGRRTRRRSRRTASARAIAGKCTTSSRRPPTSCSRNIRSTSTPSPATCSRCRSR